MGNLGPMVDIDFQHQRWNRFSPHAKDFVKKCIECYSDLRSTTTTLLTHPWIKQHSQHREICFEILNEIIKKNLSKDDEFEYSLNKKEFVDSLLRLKKVSSTEVAEQIFEIFDDKKTGLIVYNESKQISSDEYQELEQVKLEGLYKIFSSTKLGFVDLRQFAKVLKINNFYLSKQEFILLFSIIDQNGNGKLSFPDMKNFMLQ